jgi:bifunctional enzyme CysN/CysC
MTAPFFTEGAQPRDALSRAARIVLCGAVGRDVLDRLATAHSTDASATPSFIVGDPPDGEHRVRDVAIDALRADGALVVVDARQGLDDAVRRDTLMLALLRVPRVVLAVDRMDLVLYAHSAFARVEEAYRAFAREVGLDGITAVPVSTVRGDNIAEPGGQMRWYEGPTLIACLHRIALDERARDQPFRMPVQSVEGASAEARRCAGTIASGVVARGDAVMLQPSGRTCRVLKIEGASGDLQDAAAHRFVTLTLDDAADARRGGVLCAPGVPVGVADQFEASIVWTAAAPLLRGRSYRMQIATATAHATIAPIKYRIAVDSLEHVAADTLARNEIGVADLELDRALAFEPFADNRALGGFTLFDRVTGDAAGLGQIRFALRRSQNVHRQPVDIDRIARARQKSQRPCVLWFTGLSGAGKSTIANLLEMRLHALGRHTYLLDGDNVRKGLNKDLGFTAEDRVENIRRIAEVAALMADAGLIVLTAFISPFRNERRMARALVPEGEFLEIFVDTPLEVAERRDSKGLYRKARRGELANFTGIDSPYEAPEDADVRIDGGTLDPSAAADQIVAALRQRGILGA